MISISTHVLDTRAGEPATGIEVKLESVSDGAWVLVASGQTDDDGRVAELASGLAAGHYRLRFNTSDYGEGFFPEVTVTCNLEEERPHYHIPVLLSTFGFTTYRGS